MLHQGAMAGSSPFLRSHLVSCPGNKWVAVAKMIVPGLGMFMNVPIAGYWNRISSLAQMNQSTCIDTYGKGHQLLRPTTPPHLRARESQGVVAWQFEKRYQIGPDQIDFEKALRYFLL